MRQTEVTGVQTSKFLQKHLMRLIAVLAKVKQYPNLLNSEVQVTEISFEECLEENYQQLMKFMRIYKDSACRKRKPYHIY